MTIFRSFWTAMFCLMLLTLCAPAQENKPAAQSATEISGDAFVGIGPSSVPVYLRGFGRKETNDSGLDLYVNHGKFGMVVAGSYHGAQCCDNFDRFDSMFQFSYRVLKVLDLELRNDQIFSLNNLPRVDPAARTKTSNINWMRIGVGHVFLVNRFRIPSLSINAWRGIRGDLPLFFRSPSRPYATQAADADLTVRLFKATNLRFQPFLYANDNLHHARLENTLNLERTFFANSMLGKGIVFVVGGTFNKNVNVPAGMEAHGSSLLNVGARIPFGTRL